MQTMRITLPGEVGPVAVHLLSRLVGVARRASARHRQRRALARLDARLLRDVGISPEQAQAEAAKPFWRA